MVIVALAILGVVPALFNTMTPSGRSDVVGRVAEVTPKIMVKVAASEVEPNTPVKTGSVRFRTGSDALTVQGEAVPGRGQRGRA